jgi:hypothetical protein
MELLEVGEHSQWRLGVPAVADGLEVVVGGCDVTVRFLRFDKEADVAVVRGEVEGVVGAALTASRDGRLHFNFLLVGIGLLVVVHVPAQRDEELVDEVLANFGLLVVGGQIAALVGLKPRGKFADLLARVLEREDGHDYNPF